MEHFKKLNSLNVNEHTEKKKNLTYLSWAWAWAETKKLYPGATYKVIKFEGLPYAYDINTGYMVYTEVNIEGLTHEMWLPIMDGANKAMKSEPYTYKTKFGDKICLAATMFNVNKTIMRCLTKNLAMFGLGLYIYSGEDLPEVTEEQQQVILDELNTLSEAAGVTFDQTMEVFNKLGYEGTVDKLNKKIEESIK
jgi:hypothetical protein